MIILIEMLVFIFSLIVFYSMVSGEKKEITSPVIAKALACYSVELVPRLESRKELHGLVYIWQGDDINDKSSLNTATLLESSEFLYLKFFIFYKRCLGIPIDEIVFISNVEFFFLEYSVFKLTKSNLKLAVSKRMLKRLSILNSVAC